jgi:anti-anti-sigma factor
MSKDHRVNSDEPPEGMKIKIYEDCSATIIDILEEEVTSQAQINDFARRVGTKVSQLGHRQVIINCNQVRWVSSRMLGILVEMHRKLEAKQGQLHLVGVTDSVKEVLKVTHLDAYLNIHVSLDEAFSTFG